MAGRLPPNPADRDIKSPGSARRLAALLCALLVALPALIVAAPPEARAATPTQLLGRPRVGEFQPVRGDNFIAWQQNTRRNPDRFDVFARALDGSGTFRVNPLRVNAANGDIDGDVLVYQQFRFPRSKLKLFDLVTRTHSNLPSEANSPRWEYWPSMSGNLVLFGRLFDNGARRIILLDLSSNTARRLDKVRGQGTFLAPGQVNGDYAVWHKCRSNRDCDVVLFHIPDGERTTIPNPAGRQHSPSVTSDGTVFFARSRGGCGSGVRLVRRPLDGTAAMLTRLPSGDDISATDAYTDADGITTVLFDQYDCERAAVSDAWQIGEDLTPELTVTLDGGGSGIVTSSPAGIDCGSDCTETYALGTGVTLTAEPSGTAAFAGWSGACTGSTKTCTLEMDGPKSVTATFTTKPVLTVTKSGTGTGTVTSSPTGINCGTDCNQPYNEGTSVTLTASPAADSTFVGWGGACSGSQLTCEVTMNVSKEVIATFNLRPVLTVTTSGDGTVTSSPAGINCPGDCSEPYATGTDVTLTATPDAGWSFDSWTGCDAPSGNQCTMDMTTNKSVTATFTLDDVTLTVNLGGDGTGTVTGPGISCEPDCTETYAPGTEVTLTASADPGSTFEGWGGACSGTDASCTVTMDGDKSVSASFDDPLI